MFSIKGQRYYVLEGHPSRHGYGTIIVKVSQAKTRPTGRRRVYFRQVREGGAEIGVKPENCLEEAFQKVVVCLGPLRSYGEAVVCRRLRAEQLAEIEAASR